MRGFKVGDIVAAYDGSGVMGLDEEGKLNNQIHGTCIFGRDFEVIAANCELPIRVCVGLDLDGYAKNDLILRALDNNQVIFITSNQVKLKHRCNSCPSCGQEL
jgi:hypothetical protein